MPQESCYVLPEALTLTQGALSEPLAIGVYAAKSSIPLAGARVGILGSGPIGISVLASVLSHGAAAVFVTDVLEERLAVAGTAGATWTGNPDKVNVVEQIVALETPGLDVVFECCGRQEALDQALQMLKPGGKLMIVGIPEVDRVSFSIDLLRRKEICIQNVRRQEGCVTQTLEGMATGALDVDFMVTHRFPFGRTKEAFDLVAGYRDGVVKAMIDVVPS
jgi:L-iditol 2-dehydrogenase